MTTSFALHETLIGQAGSRDSINTPALILDIDALRGNIARMSAFAQQLGLTIRPHAKSHKSADVARLLNEAGVVGHCCAKIGEAEALANEGIDHLLITSPVVTAPAIARLVALNRCSTGLGVVVDDPSIVTAMAQAVGAGPPLTVLVDIDTGSHRTGVSSAADAVLLARKIVNCPELRYAGVQFYCGQEQHIASYPDRRAAISERTDYLRTVIEALTRSGLAPRIVTGGGTGSHRIDAELRILTELQPGSYLLMDRDYNNCDIDGRGSPIFATALRVDARVISTNHPAMVTIDAGLKAFATDAGTPVILCGAPADSFFIFMGDEHGAIILPEHAAQPALGSRITLATPHCDPTVNLYDAYHVVQGSDLVAVWPVTARGRSA